MTNIFDKVKKIIEERNAEYGDVAESFANIAKRWSTTLKQNVTAQQVALCMIDLKLSRLHNNPNSEDSIVDIFGYAHCLHQLQLRHKKCEMDKRSTPALEARHRVSQSVSQICKEGALWPVLRDLCLERKCLKPFECSPTYNTPSSDLIRDAIEEAKSYRHWIDKVSETMRKHKLTKWNLAKMSGLSITTIKSIFSGKSHPSEKSKGKIDDAIMRMWKK